jgi:hypothetical protein
VNKLNRWLLTPCIPISGNIAPIKFNEHDWTAAFPGLSRAR